MGRTATQSGTTTRRPESADRRRDAVWQGLVFLSACALCFLSVVAEAAGPRHTNEGARFRPLPRSEEIRLAPTRRFARGKRR